MNAIQIQSWRCPWEEANTKVPIDGRLQPKSLIVKERSGAPGGLELPTFWFVAVRPTLLNLARGVANRTESASWGKFPQPAFSFIYPYLRHFCRDFLQFALHFRDSPTSQPNASSAQPELRGPHNQMRLSVLDIHSGEAWTLPTLTISGFTRTCDGMTNCRGRSLSTDDNRLRTTYLVDMQFEPLIRPCKTVGSTSRVAGSYKPR